jgi:hypothetical protein
MAAGATVAMPAAAMNAAPGGGLSTGPSTVQMDRRAPLSAPAAAAPVNAGDKYEIHIHAAPGMDERAIARAVAAELDRRERSKLAARRSSLSDIS